MKKNLLGLLAKYPDKGKVKTRLSRDIGEEAAALIYRIIAERVVRDTSPEGNSGFERRVFYADPGDRDRFESWIPGEKLLAQRGGDIGEIMNNAIADLLKSGAEKAVITGVDIPGLNRDIVTEGFRGLDNSDVVIGPAEDGGYYLIGMRTPHPEIFRGISWSTERVFEQTVKAIETMGLSYATVRTLYDIDRAEDIGKCGNLFRGIKRNP